MHSQTWYFCTGSKEKLYNGNTGMMMFFRFINIHTTFLVGYFQMLQKYSNQINIRIFLAWREKKQKSYNLCGIKKHISRKFSVFTLYCYYVYRFFTSQFHLMREYIFIFTFATNIAAKNDENLSCHINVAWNTVI